VKRFAQVFCCAAVSGVGAAGAGAGAAAGARAWMSSSLSWVAASTGGSWRGLRARLRLPLSMILCARLSLSRSPGASTSRLWMPIRQCDEEAQGRHAPGPAGRRGYPRQRRSSSTRERPRQHLRPRQRPPLRTPLRSKRPGQSASPKSRTPLQRIPARPLLRALVRLIQILRMLRSPL